MNKDILKYILYPILIMFFLISGTIIITLGYIMVKTNNSLFSIICTMILISYCIYLKPLIKGFIYKDYKLK